jgi:hypothetical protein
VVAIRPRHWGPRVRTGRARCAGRGGDLPRDEVEVAAKLLTARSRWQLAAVFVAVVLLAVVGRALFSLAHPTHATVASYFDNPPAWPGQPWSRNGVEVSNEVLETSAGPQHCAWQSATIMFIGWPPGTDATSAGQAREYIRDTKGALLDDRFLRGSFEHDPALPPDAIDTGFRYAGLLKLYLAPSDEDRYVYLIAPADSERWPRSDPMTLCE